MKKSLLILSMLALTATSARAYDTLEAGTADASQNTRPVFRLFHENSAKNFPILTGFAGYDRILTKL